MNQVHLYFLIQTQIGEHTTYLANTQYRYLPNILTQTKGVEISELAKGFIDSIIDLEEGEKVEYLYSSDQGQLTYVLVSVNLAYSRPAKSRGCNWVGADFVFKAIAKHNNLEKELIITKLNSSRSLYEQLRTAN